MGVHSKDTVMNSLRKELRVKGNTPDFILVHFIVFSCADT